MKTYTLRFTAQELEDLHEALCIAQRERKEAYPGRYRELIDRAWNALLEAQGVPPR